jgi:hypothetical protein
MQVSPAPKKDQGKRVGVIPTFNELKKGTGNFLLRGSPSGSRKKPACPLCSPAIFASIWMLSSHAIIKARSKRK